jgi:hypothetical protein
LIGSNRECSHRLYQIFYTLFAKVGERQGKRLADLVVNKHPVAAITTNGATTKAAESVFRRR